MKLHKTASYHLAHGRTLLHLDLGDIEAAGFKSEAVSEDLFNHIWSNLAKYYDANWLELVADACENAGLEREEQA